MEKDKSKYVLVIIVLIVALVSLYTKNRGLKVEAEELQYDYYSSTNKLQELKDEHDTLLWEHENLETEYEDFKGCVEDHVYDEDYNEMRNTYYDCF